MTKTNTRPVAIAVFDFDDTIMEGHSPVRMVRHLSFSGVISFFTALKTFFWGVRYKLHLPVDQSTVRRYIFEGFSHLEADKADKIIIKFYHNKLHGRLRPKALAEIERLRSSGIMIVIVSASFEPIIKEAACDIGVDHYISTQMQVVDGYYNGHVRQPTPEGEQKVLQFKAWADKTFGDDGWQLVSAYGDHRTDRYILGTAKRAVAVSPDSGLEKIAKKQGWEIVDWTFKPARKS